jgi:hypothetical protein
MAYFGLRFEHSILLKGKQTGLSVTKIISSS